MLTPKQEAFCKAIVYDGMSYSDAYRTAYNAEKMTDKSINEKASRLKDEVKISARIKELRVEMDSPRILSAQKRLEWLSQLIESEEETTTDKLRAVDLMNKMQGEYVQKVVADVDTTYTINIELEGDDEEVT